MFLVESQERPSDPILTPWVRVVRQEANPDSIRLPRDRFHSVDVIHIDYLDEVIRQHILPFADEFGRRAVKLSDVTVHDGVVANLDQWEWNEIRRKPSK